MKRALNRPIGNSAGQLCPECDAPITSESINIKEGVALCPQCETLSPLSELNYSGRSKHELLNKPPKGCRVESRGLGTAVTVSLRSIPGLLGTLAAALFWNSIVSVFVLVAAAGLYANLVGAVPEWFPAPGVEDGQPIMNDAPMGMGMTLFLCIFLLPFVTIGAILIAAVLVNLAGKVDVSINGPDSYVATGIAFLRWKRRFDSREIHAVNLATRMWQSEGEYKPVIELSGHRSIRFGSMMSEEKMEWTRTVLKELILNPDSQFVRNLSHSSLIR